MKTRFLDAKRLDSSPNGEYCYPYGEHPIWLLGKDRREDRGGNPQLRAFAPVNIHRDRYITLDADATCEK